MISRVDRSVLPLRRAAPVRGRRWQGQRQGQAQEDDSPLAFAYSNGVVSVEISQAALDAYVELTGDVPLPIINDSETGDQRTYDPTNRVRVVRDAAGNVREVATRSNDGLFVRINFTDGNEVD